MTRRDTSENQAKNIFLGIGSNLGNRIANIEKAKSLSRGQFSGEITTALQAAADKYASLRSTASASKAVIILCLLIASIAYAYNRLSKNNRTREPVEIFLQWLFDPTTNLCNWHNLSCCLKHYILMFF